MFMFSTVLRYLTGVTVTCVHNRNEGKKENKGGLFTSPEERVTQQEAEEETTTTFSLFF